MRVNLRVRGKKLRRSSKVRLYEAVLSQLLSAKAEKFNWQEEIIGATVEMLLHGSVKISVSPEGRITTERRQTLYRRP